MRGLTLSFVILGTPALAHHEVVVTTSMLPLIGGLAVIAGAVGTGLRQWFRQKQR